MPACEDFAGFQAVQRAAVGALGFAGVGHVQVDLGMAVPQLHVGLGAGAEHAALGVEVLGRQFDGGIRCHACLSLSWVSRDVQTRVSQWAYLGLRPLTMSKKACWIFSVRGPRLPAPISMRSTSRMGVTSAAVPVKKTSSRSEEHTSELQSPDHLVCRLLLE